MNYSEISMICYVIWKNSVEVNELTTVITNLNILAKQLI